VAGHRRDFLLAAAFAPLWAAHAAAAPQVHVLRIADMAFGRPPTGLRVGDSIEWVNADAFRHTATARNGSFDLDLEPGRKGRMVLRKAGVTEFYCRYHPGMKGRLVVSG
jgi:plastocyanin